MIGQAEGWEIIILRANSVAWDHVSADFQFGLGVCDTHLPPTNINVLSKLVDRLGDDGQNMKIILFSKALLISAMGAIKNYSSIIFGPTLECQETIFSDIDMIFTRGEQFLPTKREMECRALTLLEQVISSEQAVNSRASFESKMFMKMLKFIDGNINTKISTSCLMKLCEMSKDEVERVFRNHTGLTPFSFIQARRLDLARELIEVRGFALARVAYDLGFSSQAHLTSAYKAKFSITPGAAKRKFG